MSYFDCSHYVIRYNTGLVLGTNNWNGFTHRFIIYKLLEFLILIQDYLLPSYCKAFSTIVLYPAPWVAIQWISVQCSVVAVCCDHSFVFVLCFVFCVCMFPLDWTGSAPHSPISHLSCHRVECDDQDHSTLLYHLLFQIR